MRRAEDSRFDSTGAKRRVNFPGFYTRIFSIQLTRLKRRNTFVAIASFLCIKMFDWKKCSDDLVTRCYVSITNFCQLALVYLKFFLQFSQFFFSFKPENRKKFIFSIVTTLTRYKENYRNNGPAIVLRCTPNV